MYDRSKQQQALFASFGSPSIVETENEEFEQDDNDTDKGRGKGLSDSASAEALLRRGLNDMDNGRIVVASDEQLLLFSVVHFVSVSVSRIVIAPSACHVKSLLDLKVNCLTIV